MMETGGRGSEGEKGTGNCRLYRQSCREHEVINFDRKGCSFSFSFPPWMSLWLTPKFGKNCSYV